MKSFIHKHFTRLPFFIAALLLFVGIGVPAFFNSAAAAGQITNRSLTISTSVPNVSATYTIGDGTTGFKLPANGIVKGFKVEACTLAVGTCATPTSFSWAGSGGYTLTNWTDSTSFTKDTTSIGDCDGTNVRILCLSRSGASTQESTSGFHKIVITGVNNPNLTNTAYFLRITTYSSATYVLGNILDQGTVATATTISNLQVNAAVAEILNFCVGATTTDNNTSDPTASGAHDCSVISGTSVNLGTLDSTKVNVTPVSANGGDSNNGIAMVRSNALNDTFVSYAAVNVAGSGTAHTRDLRITNVNCEAQSDNTWVLTTDACFNSMTTQGFITAGTEKWGMTVAGVNCGSSASYSACTDSSSSHMVRTTNYDGNGAASYTAEANQSVTTTTTNGYAWDEGGTAVSLATSVGAGTPQIDDEALILKFAATPSITTPFGSYLAKADFVCVSTY